MGQASLHPIVAAYLGSGEPFFRVLAGAAASPEPMVRAMGALRDALGQARDPETALAEARGIAMDSAEPALTIPFLGLWAALAAKLGRAAEVESLVHRLRAFDVRAIPPGLRAPMAFAAGLLDRVRGDLGGVERHCREAVALVPADSPRRPDQLVELAMLLATLGRATEIEPELRALEPGAPFSVHWRLIPIWFIQYAETGRAAEAEREAGRLADAPWDLLAYLEADLAVARTLSALLRGRWATDAPVPGAAEAAGGWSAVVDRLLQRRPDEALALARAQAQTQPDQGLYHPLFPGWNLVRAELAAGHGDAARHLLDLRTSRGVRHWLDDPFLARITRLPRRQDAAAYNLPHSAASAGGARP